MESVRHAAFAGSLALAFALSPAARAAPDEPTPRQTRPRLGLVLSGGGARGAAHIGVLHVLEEMRIPVDLITGTSMGSVIGGLYAAGLSPDELDATIQDTDWVKVFADSTDRQNLSFRRKQDDRNFLTSLRVSFKNWSFFIPSGVAEGQKLDFLLRSLTLGPDGLARVEDLRIPFRAVATDIATGEPVIFDKGPLAVAQRASMSIPAAFSPVVVDGHVLVDGYVANNLPVDVAQEAGAEAVIAVDISTPTSKLEALATAVAISGQVSTLPVQQQQKRQIERLAANDVLLQPDLGDLDASDFTQMQEAIEIGRQAALAAKDRLARYSVSEEDYAEWRAHQRRGAQQLPVIDTVRIENRSALSDHVLWNQIETEPGAPLDLDRLSRDLGRLFGLDAFERVRFDVRREAEGTVLVYEMVPRERGTNYVRFGLNLESDITNESVFNFAINDVWAPINAWNGEVRVSGQLGDDSRVDAELYQPLGPQDWLFALPFVNYDDRDEDVFVGEDRFARFDLEQTVVGMYLGVNFWNVAQIRGGIGYADTEATLQIGDPVLHHQQASGGIYAATLEFDTLDDARFPNDGSYVRVDSLFFRKELGFRHSFEKLSVHATTFRTWRKNTVGVGLQYETSFASNPDAQALSTLGGFLNHSGFPRNSLVGAETGLAQLFAYRRIASPAVFAWQFPVYVGGVFEIGNAWERHLDVADLLISAGPFIGVDTPLGPLYIAYAHGEGGHNQAYIFLGRSF